VDSARSRQTAKQQANLRARGAHNETQPPVGAISGAGKNRVISGCDRGGNHGTRKYTHGETKSVGGRPGANKTCSSPHPPGGTPPRPGGRNGIFPFQGGAKTSVGFRTGVAGRGVRTARMGPRNFRSAGLGERGVGARFLGPKKIHCVVQVNWAQKQRKHRLGTGGRASNGDLLDRPGGGTPAGTLGNGSGGKRGT